jgi:hypothetical protein
MQYSRLILKIIVFHLENAPPFVPPEYSLACLQDPFT